MKKSEMPFRSTLGPSMGRYLALKRALGRRYAQEERILQSLDEFLGPHLHPKAGLNSASFSAWCRTFQHVMPTVRRNRMRVARNFSLYRRRTEPTCFVPDITSFPQPHQAVKPYIFAKEEIARLIASSRILKPGNQSPLRAEVYSLAIILLYCTGMRRGELIRLSLGDYDAKERTLFVRETKFHKSRYIPLSPDATREVQRYLEVRRRRRLPLSPEAALLWNRSRGGRHFTGEGLAQGLRRLLEASGIRKPDGCQPRVHDFRHSFAVQALLRWYRAGHDVQAKLPLLATYMGHVSVASTEYYVHFVEPLARSASARFEKRCGTLVNAGPQKKGNTR